MDKPGAKIHFKAKFLSRCEPVKPENKLSASEIQWWDRHRLVICIPQGRNKKEGRSHDSKQV